MSLDARLEKIARDEVARALSGAAPVADAQQDAGLREQVSDLHEHLHRALTRIDHLTRRVDTLEQPKGKTPGDVDDSDGATPLPEATEPPTSRPRRSTRKAT